MAAGFCIPCSTIRSTGCRIRFALGQQLMNAVLCTNVVYPVYTRGQYIRHYTPGRWWDCVYTWDSGFIGMGLAQTSLRNAFDCLNTYLMPPGSCGCCFFTPWLHGANAVLSVRRAVESHRQQKT